MTIETLSGTIAPLVNVGLFVGLMERVASRDHHLPGMGVFHGPSGYGKTFAATLGANQFKAAYVEVKSAWTKKSLLTNIARELGLLKPGEEGRVGLRTVADLTDRIAAELAMKQKPLIIDEGDYIVDRNMVDTVRDLYESSQSRIVLIGEERLPQKLERFERFHNRILDWVGAQPASLEDAAVLAKLYCKEIDIAEDLLAMIHQASKGSVRRVCVNLARVDEQRKLDNPKSIDAKWWGSRELFTGQPPVRRVI